MGDSPLAAAQRQCRAQGEAAGDEQMRISVSRSVSLSFLYLVYMVVVITFATFFFSDFFLTISDLF